MLANKPVLPNFLKTLSIALFTLSTISAYADGHGDHKKIGDLKEMTSDAGAQAEEEAISELSDLDTAAEELMSDAEGAATGEAAEAKEGIMDDLKTKASSLAEE